MFKCNLKFQLKCQAVFHLFKDRCRQICKWTNLEWVCSLACNQGCSLHLCSELLGRTCLEEVSHKVEVTNSPLNIHHQCTVCTLQASCQTSSHLRPWCNNLITWADLLVLCHLTCSNSNRLLWEACLSSKDSHHSLSNLGRFSLYHQPCLLI